MVRYLAEAFYMDSDDLARGLGEFSSILEANRACQRHALILLEFRPRTPGVWKAQGEEVWYRITRLEE